MVGKVAKFDFNTNNGVRVRFIRMTVYVNLEKVIISQVLINDTLQRIEYEYLPSVCFSCGHYGHVKEICPKILSGQPKLEEQVTKIGQHVMGPTLTIIVFRGRLLKNGLGPKKNIGPDREMSNQIKPTTRPGLGIMTNQGLVGPTRMEIIEGATNKKQGHSRLNKGSGVLVDLGHHGLFKKGGLNGGNREWNGEVGLEED